jgi:hypothetical protein
MFTWIRNLPFFRRSLTLIFVFKGGAIYRLTGVKDWHAQVTSKGELSTLNVTVQKGLPWVGLNLDEVAAVFRVG